ncbi:Protein STB5 [Spathaspora sp. JA1]|nr:Protein STB5 [Spathaspora sp. JA1]
MTSQAHKISFDSSNDYSNHLVTKFRIKKPLSLSKSHSKESILDVDNNSKLTSCIRCRKLKKKCNKTIPECQNCEKSGEPCVYIPRKPRRSKTELEIQASDLPLSLAPDHDTHPKTETRNSVSSVNSFNGTPSGTISSPGSVHSMTTSTLSGINPIDARAPDFNSYAQQVSKVLVSAVSIKTNSNVSIIPPIVDRELLTRIINAFFMHNYRAVPVINKHEFITKFNKMFSEDNVSDLHEFDDQFELYMVLAIGSTGLERCGIISRDKKISEFFVSQALNHVHNNLSSNNLKNVKYLILLGLYSFFDPSEFTSWEIMGKLTRLTIHLGLNKPVLEQEKKFMTPRQVELRSRLFWSVYIIDRLTSVSLGRPVAINDEDINVPLPQILDDDHEDIEINRVLIKLRRIEGQILRRVHSVSLQNNSVSEETRQLHCQEVYAELRRDIDDWYNQAICINNQNTTKASFSFHGSNPWYFARYHHLLVLLYRPSYLNPNPPSEILQALGKSCLENLSSSYKLFIAKLLPLNWTTLYRFLMICTTILYCLCKWSIDLVESKTEICYCIEILQAFGSNWIVAKRCAQVFKQIENKLLEISLTSDGHTDMDKLSRELLGASSSYHEILNSYTNTFEFMLSF